jgi:hypothetical protein
MSEENAPAGNEAAPSSKLRSLLTAFCMDRPFARGEFIVALMLLGFVALLALEPCLRHGGFHLDDWSNAALSLQPPGSPNLGRAISAYSGFTLYRPVLVLYLPLVYFVLGMHMHLHLALAAVLAVLAGTTFYAVLRTLGTPWLHAGLIAALAILFPWSDSTRLWATAGLVTLSVLFMLVGLFVALQGLRRRSWRWHAWAALLYLLSILTYEATLPLIACFGALYWLRSGWQAARWRWLADLGAVVVGGTWVGVNTTHTKSSLSGDLKHLWQIVEGGGTILGRAGLPLGSQATTLALLCLAVILASGCIAYIAFPSSFASKGGWGLRSWLQMMFGGIAVATLAWVMFIPADRYYTPAIYGEINRVNGVAGFGLVLVIYGAFGVVGTLIGKFRRRSMWLASTVTVLLGVILALSYAHVLRRHIDIWNSAYSAEVYAIQETKKLVPDPPSGTTIIAGSYPSYQAPWVPILAATWDYDGMVKMEYNDFSLSAIPVLDSLGFHCKANALVVTRGDEIVKAISYGTVRLVNLATGEHTSPQGQLDCRREMGSYVPGPISLSPTY